MRKYRGLRWLGVACVVIAGLSFIHPFGIVKGARPKAPLLAGAAIDSESLGIIERSCRDCHSDETHWPWYSYIAPVSWMVEKDVSQARGRFDLSRWQDYSAERRAIILRQMSVLVPKRDMPLPRYLLLHRDARLSESDRQHFAQWATAASAELEPRGGS